MFLPGEYKKYVNGKEFIGELDNWSLRKLFRHRFNIEYLHGSITKLSSFRVEFGVIEDSVYDYDNQIFREDYTLINKAYVLSLVNRKFVIETSNHLVMSPGINTIGNEITPFEGGHWHPEYLTTSSYRNSKTAHHQNLLVEFDASPDAVGLGHRYNREVYASKWQNRSQFPHWQYSVNRRAIERDIDGLREGGISDRRVESSRGYNNSYELLTSKVPRGYNKYIY
jgi:hypothetical protein